MCASSIQLGKEDNLCKAPMDTQKNVFKDSRELNKAYFSTCYAFAFFYLNLFVSDHLMIRRYGQVAFCC